MTNKTIVSSTIHLDIPFFDVDPMGITWHGNYMKYFEIARCSLLEKINYSYIEMKHSNYAWPIVDIRIKYIKPTEFRQHISIEALLVEYENRLKIEYVIKDKLTQEKLTTGYSIQVAVCLKTKEMCFISPNIVSKKLEKYL